MNAREQLHCAEIHRCNQRGGRMLSIVDLIEAGTVTAELAAYSLAAIRGGASFMVGAMPGGAGKTTVMGALLNFVPRETALAAADGAHAIAGPGDRTCYVCHEIGSGAYYAYLWDEPLRQYFALAAAGHQLATNLHADTYADARRQVCEDNGVAPGQFRRMNLVYFLALVRQPAGVQRRVATVWESDGLREHRLVFGPGAERLPAGSSLVSPAAFDAAGETIRRLLATGARTIEDVRARLVAEGAV